MGESWALCSIKHFIVGVSWALSSKKKKKRKKKKKKKKEVSWSVLMHFNYQVRLSNLASGV